MEKVRKIPLENNAIQNAIRDLKQIKNEIVSINIEDLLDEAVKYCMSLTPLSDNQGNHLKYNTYWVKTSNGYRIVQEGENVTYVEFGTGVKGGNSPHPETRTYGWVYGVGPHIFETKDGRTGWFFPLDGNKISYRFTEGQPANMQMYKTGLWLKERLHNNVKMKVERAISKW